MPAKYRSVLLWSVAVALFCPAVRSHEIGTTRVTVLFEAGRNYTIEIVTDATALVEKLSVSSGVAPPTDTAAGHLQALLTGYDDKFRQRVKASFDGADVRPDISYAVVPATGAGSAPAATIRLTGQIPQGASKFTWTFAWTFASYAFTIRNADSANPMTQWLEGSQTSTPFELSSTVLAATRAETAWRYLKLGFTHILPNGLDHMLFVLGIYLLSGRARTVLLQVSAFTIAHSITLGLSLYGLVSVSPRIVEPAIAISIAYVAIENILLSELKPWRIVLVFAFGLWHGMGFAGALKDLGLPRSEFLTALLTFNIGVELAQLAVIAVAFVLVGWHYADRPWYRARIVIPASLAIACTAIYWTIQRLVA